LIQYPGFKNYVQKNWPEKGFAYPDPLLPDPNNVRLSLLEMKGPSTAVTIEKNKLFATSLRTQIDSVPREKAAKYLYDAAFDCLGFRGDELSFLKDQSPASIAKLVENPLLPSTLKLWPLSTREVERSIKKMLSEQ
jgi:hypothetical protein